MVQRLPPPALRRSYDSFFQKDDIGKRYAISRKDGRPFGVAGIWENWNDPATRQWVRTFAIITVPANDLVAAVHDRMPAILDKANFSRWFADEADPRALLVPYPSDALSITQIGKRSR
jgi:putative SOS response-associated peptidase YedK